MRKATPYLVGLAGALAATTACDYSGDWLFAGAVDGLDPIQHLGELEVALIEEYEQIAENIYYGEVGPTGTPEVGGVTFTFLGTGGNVCVWVDPEVAYWLQSLSPIYGVTDFSWPDNVFDDGDLDIEAGLAVFYNGSPDEEMGSFEIRYEDSLGNVVPISANECVIPYYGVASGGHAGRGHPEYCTLENTQPGVNYLVALETFTTPIDDDRLAYGLLVAEGDCSDLITLSGAPHYECVIPEESIDPTTCEPGDIENCEPLPDHANFENAFCASHGQIDFLLYDYCDAEASELDCDDEEVHCFCGSPETQSPIPGEI